MASARASRYSVPRAHSVDPAPLRPVLQAAKVGSAAPEVVPLGLPVQQLLLRSLVERFGGEATMSTLTRYLTYEQNWTSAAPGPGLTDILRTLEGLGAVDLELDGDHDLIVRVLPDGAERYV